MLFVIVRSRLARWAVAIVRFVVMLLAVVVEEGVVGCPLVSRMWANHLSCCPPFLDQVKALVVPRQSRLVVTVARCRNVVRSGIESLLALCLPAHLQKWLVQCCYIIVERP